MNPLFHTDFSISDSLRNVRKSVLIYETIIENILCKNTKLEKSRENRILQWLEQGEKSENKVVDLN